MTNHNFPIIPKLIATSLGCGYWPWGPGTMGAIGGLALWLAIAALVHSATAMWLITAALIVIFTWLGVWAGTVAERFWGPDPSRVVIDETVGQWLAMLPISTIAGADGIWHAWQWWTAVALSLVLFRFFDIAKPLGVRYMERYPAGWGIMLDDVLAGTYAGFIVTIFIFFV